LGIDADTGLELTTFISGVDERSLATTLAPFADQPVPIAKDLQDLWSAYGFRMMSVPVEQVPSLLGALQTAGSTQRQWLGQAYSWTEAVHAAPANGRVITLDAERIRLAPGNLRLLVRSWVEPIAPQVESNVGEVTVPGNDGSGGAAPVARAPAAILRVELVPQNRESRTPEQMLDPLAVNEPRLEPETQGLLFSRLYTRMSLAPGRAILIVPDRPEADWTKLAAEPSPHPSKPASSSTRRSEDPDAVSWTKPSSSATAEPAPAQPDNSAAPVRTGPPKLGEVVRTPPRPTPAEPAKPVDQPPSEAGPIAARVPTLGEAMLMSDPPVRGARNAPPQQRILIVLIPKVPREFRLLPTPAAATPTAAPAQPG
jgi:hypothetical protein